jgi:hypothetical protein
MKFQNLLAASNSQEILAVIEGLPVDANGYFLTEAQMEAIEEVLSANAIAMSANEQTAAALAEQIATANTARDEAAAALVTANETIAARDARIVELATELENGPAKEEEATRRDADEQGKDKTPRYARADHPANRAADKFIRPKKKD